MEIHKLKPMTPTEKANELIDKYVKLQIAILYKDEEFGQCIASGNMLEESAVKCALLEVQGILNLNVCWWSQDLVRDYPKKYKPEDMYEFWEKILLILEKK